VGISSSSHYAKLGWFLCARLEKQALQAVSPGHRLGEPSTAPHCGA